MCGHIELFQAENFINIISCGARQAELLVGVQGL